MRTSRALRIRLNTYHFWKTKRAEPASNIYVLLHMEADTVLC